MESEEIADASDTTPVDDPLLYLLLKIEACFFGDAEESQ